MYVIIVGAGEVGATIAEGLADSHEVVVVDVDGDLVESLTYSLDVLPVEGDGASLSTLQEAGVEDADMLIASTDDDETNIVTCGTAQTVGNPFTIARVRNTNYLDTWNHSEGALGVDFMVGTNHLTAETIAQVIGLPASRDVSTFANGLVQMVEFEIIEGSRLAGQTVSEADRFSSLTFAAVLRGGDVVIPSGDTVIETGDEVVVIGSEDSVRQFGEEVCPDDEDASDVLILGGSAIGYLTAELLAQQEYEPRIVERDPLRARELAEDLASTTVLEHDATDASFLEREHVDRVDAVVATLGDDGQNLMAGLLAKRLGAKRAITIVEDAGYVDLFESVGIDVAVNPREETAEEITRFTRERHAENVAIIESEAEVVEIEVDTDSVLADKPISESVKALPEGVVIGAITRNDELVIPRGETVIEVDDHVVVFVDEHVIEEATTKL